MRTSSEYIIFRTHGDNIIYVPVGYIRLGVKVAVSLFAGLDFRLAEGDIFADISASLNEQTYLRRLDYSNSADSCRICKSAARDSYFERAVGAFENIAVPILIVSAAQSVLRPNTEYAAKRARACIPSSNRPVSLIIYITPLNAIIMHIII